MLESHKRERRERDRDRRVLDGTLKYRGEFHAVEVLNVSEAGAFAVAPITPDLADAITLNIQLPDGSVMITGRVRRVGLSSRNPERQGGFGIEFTRFYTPIGRESLCTHLHS